jgi:hypothetical protein
MWTGEYSFVLQNLCPDFGSPRNMSLGVFWSLLNPRDDGRVDVRSPWSFNNQPQFPLFLLCGLVPFTFHYRLISGATSLIDNANLVKRSLSRDCRCQRARIRCTS